MKKYVKLIVLSVVLLVLILLITLVMIFDVNLLLFNNLSIAGIQEKKVAVEELMAEEQKEETNYSNAKDALKKSKDSFDLAKEKYENIDDSTIAIVQEATKEEKYFVEYLWIVLGNYAEANGLNIDIITSATTNSTSGSASTTTSAKNGIKIVIEGRYANVADFVFDVENNKELRFKLDNIKMTYLRNNLIQATFDVLSLAVLQ